MPLDNYIVLYSEFYWQLLTIDLVYEYLEKNSSVLFKKCDLTCLYTSQTKKVIFVFHNVHITAKQSLYLPTSIFNISVPLRTYVRKTKSQKNLNNF